jgi:hypothetical protein
MKDHSISRFGAVLVFMLASLCLPQGARAQTTSVIADGDVLVRADQVLPGLDLSAARRVPRAGSGSIVLRWNAAALAANAMDHTPDVVPRSNQGGPVRSARALAIVHIAIFDALNSITRTHQSYTGIPDAPTTASVIAAVATAAHNALYALYPAQRATFATLLQQDLAMVPAGQAKVDGTATGRAAAAAILALRATDRTSTRSADRIIGRNYFPGPGAGDWQRDPITGDRLALGANWTNVVAPFAVTSATQFIGPNPPRLSGADFARAFNEVKNVGACGIRRQCTLSPNGSYTPTTRTRQQTIIGIFWAYDGMPALGTPPRLYNQIVTQIAADQGTMAEIDLARLFALVNVSMADAGLTAWASKYAVELARPVTAIRRASELRNRRITENPTWTPRGGPASNTRMAHFTPPFPAYVSGHAAFGAAMFQSLRNFYGGRDAIPFSFVSDEFNGITKGNMGEPRDIVRRFFTSLGQAELENAVSRIYLGIHWRFDATRGIAMGNRVANHVVQNFFRPR